MSGQLSLYKILFFWPTLGEKTQEIVCWKNSNYLYSDILIEF